MPIEPLVNPLPVSFTAWPLVRPVAGVAVIVAAAKAEIVEGVGEGERGEHAYEAARKKRPHDRMLTELLGWKREASEVRKDWASRLIVGITGATGSIFGIRLLQALQGSGVETHVVVSKWGMRMLAARNFVHGKE